MLKRSIAVAGAVAVLGGLNTQGARATEQAADAISGVTLDWADPEHTNVKITWTESEAVANTLTVTSTDPSQAATVFGSTLAGEANEYVIDSASLGSNTNPAVKRRIVVAGSDGASGQSAEFDTYTYAPKSVTLAFTTDNKVRWTLPADPSTDTTTPGDPLDFAAAYRYPAQQRIASTPGSECNVVEAEGTTAATGVVPNPGKPFNFSVNVDNEWGTVRGPVATVETTTGLTIGAPTVTQYGLTTAITGQVTRTIVAESGSPTVCDEQAVPAPNVPVVLQQRTSSTAAWTTVGTTRTDATGKYTAVATNAGWREYRILRVNTVTANNAAYGAISATKAVRSTTRVVSAKFIAPVINYGTQPQAYLWVDPAGSQNAALQFKNPSGVWQGITYKVLSSGRGIATFPFNRRGATQFRWWVPASGGAEATYSGIFTLTVR